MNLVIMPVYKLTGFPRAYPWFVKMAELCAASFRLNMANMDDVVFLKNEGRPFSSYVQMFRDVFDQTHELWKEGHNLFFTDADALCIKPIRVFGVYSDFRLFSQTEDNRFPDDFPTYMLSGSRYFPQSMDEELWEVGLGVWAREREAKDKVFGSHWDYEQYVWNHMFFAQPWIQKHWEACIHNEFNLFFEWEDEYPNAAILSYNTSASWRGESEVTMEERLQLMKDRIPELCEQEEDDVEST